MRIFFGIVLLICGIVGSAAAGWSVGVLIIGAGGAIIVMMWPGNTDAWRKR